VSESWLTDEEIAEFTTTHDVMREAQVGQFVVVGSYIPVAEVTVYLRTQRDRAQAHMDTLLLAQAASAHDKQAELQARMDAPATEPITQEAYPWLVMIDDIYNQDMFVVGFMSEAEAEAFCARVGEDCSVRQAHPPDEDWLQRWLSHRDERRARLRAALTGAPLPGGVSTNE
jgi:hypothetical protein